MKISQLIDLTYPIEEGMLTFDAPWHPKVMVKKLGRIELDGRETKMLVMGTHTGTQIDAPLHFIKGGASIDEIPLQTLLGEVTLVNFSHLGQQEDQTVTREMLRSIHISSRMIFNFGWSQHWGVKKFYQNYPHFNEEAAQYLVDQGVRVLGFDTASPDDSRTVIGGSEDSKIHKIFLSQGVLLMEYLANLNLVKEYEGWNLIALPLKIKGGDGSTARILIFKE